MAVDLPLDVSATAVALHVRECATCNEFVDELGRVRQWLRCVPLPSDLAGDLSDVGFMASAALCRELLARFARDLLTNSRGQASRPMEERVEDQQRLLALSQACAEGEGATAQDIAGVELAVREGPIEAAEALEAAAHLDPLGLDIALAWLGCLERAGRGALAHRLTDKMLARLR